MVHRLLFAVTLLVLTLSAHSAAAELRVVRVTPSGEDVPAARQVVIEFSEPMVPLGRMERRADEVPVAFTPELRCEWRWLSAVALACDLAEHDALHPATRYELRVRAGARALSGETLREDSHFTFLTERPRITTVRFLQWSAPTTPRIAFGSNIPLREHSIRDHVFFETLSGKRVPLTHNRGESTQDDLGFYTPQEKLPAGERVALKVEPGVQGEQGGEPGIEARDLSAFHTFPEFRVLGVECTHSDSTGARLISIAPGDADPQSRRCDPLGGISLVVSAPVLRDVAKGAVSTVPDLAWGRADFDPWEGDYSYSMLLDSRSIPSLYRIALPQYFRAATRYLVKVDNRAIKDEFGRALQEPIEIAFETDHRRAKIHLEHRASVLEKGVDSELPLVVTNVKDVTLNYNILSTKGVLRNQSRVVTPAAVLDLAFATPLGIRGLLGGGSGVVLGSLAPTPAIASSPSVIRSGFESVFSQVTPFAVHLKLGHFSSLAWVTSFATGAPIADAKVSLVEGSLADLLESSTVRAQGNTDAHGLISLPGTASVDPKLVLSNEWRFESRRLALKVEKGEDLAVLPVHFDFQEQPHGTWSYLRPKYGHLKSWGLSAQGIYRLGERIQFKIYLRNQDLSGLTAPPAADYALKVFDPLNKEVFRREKIKLSEFGAFDGEMLVPHNGAVGWYRFVLSSSVGSEELEPLRVLVSDFSPAPFKVTTELRAALARAGDTVDVRTLAKLHAGGPFAEAPVRVAATLRRTPLRAGGALDGFVFDRLSDDEEMAPPEELQVFEEQRSLDKNGERETRFSLPESKILFGSLTVESAVRDDRGKSIAGRGSLPYRGRDRYVGIIQDDWVLRAGAPFTVRSLVVDSALSPVKEWPISLVLRRKETKAARVKSAGNAYVTHYTSEWIEEGGCQRSSALTGVSCDLTPRQGGIYQILASIKDSAGRVHEAALSKWVVGAGEVLWRERTGNALQISSEKEEYKPGETARFIVQNPFPGATALVSVERYGVQQRWLKRLESSSEIIEVPVTKDSLPGFYLSVVVNSPRVAQPVEDQVDLGKPAFRLGYVRVPVKDDAQRLTVQVKTDRQLYKPREQVEVELSADGKTGGAVEYAVVVLDEAVLDLLPGGRALFDPYAAFYNLESLDVENFNLLAALVGRQKFEKKGASPGGDGGGDLSMRSLFKFVSYWNPALKGDAQGRARFRFTVPDNLTGWRVIALAVNRSNRMGLGEGSFSVNQPTEIRAALPNQLREGDSAQAAFTVMNRTETARTLHAKIEISGPPLEEPVIKEEQIAAAPFTRVPLNVPFVAAHEGTLTFKVSARDESDGDALSVTLPVLPQTAGKVAAIYGSSTEGVVREPVEFPSDAAKGRGRVSVVLSPSLLSGIQGAFDYLKSYPYSCWEQKLTKGLMAAHYLALKAYLPKSFSWSEAGSLPANMIADAAEHQAENGGMGYYQAGNQYADPYLSAFTALGFNWLSVLGYTIPQTTQGRLDDYLHSLLRRDVQPDFYTPGMASSVRAVALAALAERGKVSSDDLARYRAAYPQMSLFGKSFYLTAALKLRSGEVQRVVTDILAHVQETASTVTLNQALDTDFQRILESDLRTNCAALSALLRYEQSGLQPGLPRDLVVKLARSINEGRRGRDGWPNTQENIFCSRALIEFSAKYEAQPPRTEFQVLLGEAQLGEGRFLGVTNEPIEFDTPLRAELLGTTSEISLKRQGPGRLYYSARLFYSPSQPVSSPSIRGMEIRRQYSVERNGSWQALTTPLAVSTGDLVRVDLYLSLPAARNFVVVSDPLPGGLEPVQRELATSSLRDAGKSEDLSATSSPSDTTDGWRDVGGSVWSFHHRELRHDSVRFYSEHLPPGNYHLSYTAQAIAPGDFLAGPTLAEEMYQPETYGSWISERISVTRGE